MACARGWLARRSTEAANASKSSQEAQTQSGPIQLGETAFRTLGWPCVSVPVLSKAKALTLASISMTAPPLINTPRRAALVIALMMVTGVLITNAHGQAITSRDSAR